MQQEQVDFGLVAETETKKRCAVCKRRLPLDSFGKHSECKCGVSNQCRACKAMHERARQKKHREQNRELKLIGNKHCEKCNRVLSKTEFNFNRCRPDGVSVYCKDCTHAKRGQEYLSLHKQLLTRVFAARDRSKKLGTPFDLDIDFLYLLWEQQKGLCAVSGLPMIVDDLRDGAWRAPYRPSLDRIVPQLGYVRENVRLVLSIVNIAIGDWGEEKFKHVCVAVAKKIAEEERDGDGRDR